LEFRLKEAVLSKMRLALLADGWDFAVCYWALYPRNSRGLCGPNSPTSAYRPALI
jgi:hypothetical protein